MRIAINISVSSNISDVASVTLPNKIEYCLRHNYSLIVDNEKYEVASVRTDRLCKLLDNYDILWMLDADTIITNMHTKIEDLTCLGPHLTICEEGIVDWNFLNCGSIIVKNTKPSRWLLETIPVLQFQWKPLVCGWQTWINGNMQNLGDLITVAPIGAFNSCVWNKPGGGEGEPGSNWKQGDLLYHACGVFPKSEKIRYLTDIQQFIER
jgi:hypothetical protein